MYTANMIKPLALFSLTLVLISCKISGTYKWVKMNSNLHLELLQKRDSIVSDPNLKYYDYEIFEIDFKQSGNLKYRFTNRNTEGGISFTQDLPLNKGKWEFIEDTLLIYFSIETNSAPYLYKVSGDTLVPLNNKTYWKKEK